MKERDSETAMERQKEKEESCGGKGGPYGSPFDFITPNVRLQGERRRSIFIQPLQRAAHTEGREQNVKKNVCK